MRLYNFYNKPLSNQILTIYKKSFPNNDNAKLIHIFVSWKSKRKIYKKALESS